MPQPWHRWLFLTGMTHYSAAPRSTRNNGTKIRRGWSPIIWGGMVWPRHTPPFIRVNISIRNPQKCLDDQGHWYFWGLGAEMEGLKPLKKIQPPRRIIRTCREIPSFGPTPSLVNAGYIMLYIYPIRIAIWSGPQALYVLVPMSWKFQCWPVKPPATKQ